MFRRRYTFTVLLAFHCIFSTYGFWLPNEPRGSWSNFVASWDLFRLGPATKVDTRRSIAHLPYDHNLKQQMQSSLTHPPVLLTGDQAKIIGMSFQSLPYEILALAIMPDHIHVVIGRTDRDIRRVIGHMKSQASRVLRANEYFLDQAPWSAHGWNVYLDSVEDVLRAIEYVQRNPIRAGLPRQRWNCVVPFDPAKF